MSQLSYLETLLDGVQVEWKALEKVADIYDSLHKTPQYNETGLNMIRVTDIKGGYVNLEQTLKVNDEVFADFTKKYLPIKDDLVMSRVGSYGNVGIIPADNIACMGQNTVVIHPLINSKFIFYILGSNIGQNFIERNVGGGNQKTLSLKSIKAIPIPIPCPDNPEKSLAIQAEIVRILDAFTAMTAELTAELNLRKKQYNYYRDQLLSFDLSADQAGEGDVEWRALGEIGHIVTGRTPKSSDKSAWGNDVDFVTPSDIKNGMRNIAFPSRRLSAEGAASMSKVLLPSGSLLVTCIGADMGKTVINANDCIPNQQINAITLTDDSVQVGYLFHVLTAMREALRRQGELGGGTMPLINKSDFSKIVVPIPSHEEQNRIATILDKFDALTNSITEGLPREIELRQKQYEYYRDLLLSFPACPAGGPKPEEAA